MVSKDYTIIKLASWLCSERLLKLIFKENIPSDDRFSLFFFEMHQCLRDKTWKQILKTLYVYFQVKYHEN
jgi:hypothetical protein